jgi:hypothetical protein
MSRLKCKQFGGYYQDQWKKKVNFDVLLNSEQKTSDPEEEILADRLTFHLGEVLLHFPGACFAVQRHLQHNNLTRYRSWSSVHSK